MLNSSTTYIEGIDEISKHDKGEAEQQWRKASCESLKDNLGLNSKALFILMSSLTLASSSTG